MPISPSSSQSSFERIKEVAGAPKVANSCLTSLIFPYNSWKGRRRGLPRTQCTTAAAKLLSSSVACFSTCLVTPSSHFWTVLDSMGYVALGKGSLGGS